MALRNVLGDLALDATLRDVFAALGRDPSMPLFVATDPNGLPVQVYGRAEISVDRNERGQRAAADSLGVVLASDQSAVPVRGSVAVTTMQPILSTLTDGVAPLGSAANPIIVQLRDPVIAPQDVLPVEVFGTMNVAEGPVMSATVQAFTSSTTAQRFVAANPQRAGLSVFNNSTQVLYLLHGSTSTASSTMYTTQVQSNMLYELPPSPRGIFKGEVWGIWASANGTALVTEAS